MREIEQLYDITHELLITALPEGVMSVAHFLLADGYERGKEINDALHVASTAPRPCEFVMQRIEHVSRFGIEDDEVLFAATGLGIADPIGCFLSFGC